MKEPRTSSGKAPLEALLREEGVERSETGGDRVQETGFVHKS